MGNTRRRRRGPGIRGGEHRLVSVDSKLSVGTVSALHSLPSQAMQRCQRCQRMDSEDSLARVVYKWAS